MILIIRSLCAYQEHVERTAGEEKEESKETIDLVAEDSKRDSVHFKIA